MFGRLYARGFTAAQKRVATSSRESAGFDLLEGSDHVARAARRAKGADRTRLAAFAERLTSGESDAAWSDELFALMSRFAPPVGFATYDHVLEVFVARSRRASRRGTSSSRARSEGSSKRWLSVPREGPYEPVRATGRYADHVVAFRRGRVLVVVPRLVARLPGWADTAVEGHRLSALLAESPVAVVSD